MKDEKRKDEMVYLDLNSGISGDMLLGSLLDIGGSEEILDDVIGKLGLSGIDIVVEKKEEPVRGLNVRVRYEKEEQSSRQLDDILGLIERSDLTEWVKKKSLEVFRALGEAEGEIHDTEVDRVQLHEVSGVDSIVDIVGSIALFHQLNIDKAYASTVHFGSGEVGCEHGVLSVPVPATTKLLQGWRVRMTEKEGELVTPTGAALLKTLAEQRSPPDIELERVGVGYGDRVMKSPNVLRVFMGRCENIEDKMIRLDFYIDDMNPEILSHSMEKIREEAIDAYQKAAVGKKGRSGWEITVLCRRKDLPGVKEVIFRETSTLGFQISEMRRHVSGREAVIVDTNWGEVRLKVTEEQASPEFEDCRKIAEREDIPLGRVYEEALRRYREKEG